MFQPYPSKRTNRGSKVDQKPHLPLPLLKNEDSDLFLARDLSSFDGYGWNFGCWPKNIKGIIKISFAPIFYRTCFMLKTSTNHSKHHLSGFHQEEKTENRSVHIDHQKLVKDGILQITFKIHKNFWLLPLKWAWLQVSRPRTSLTISRWTCYLILGHPKNYHA